MRILKLNKHMEEIHGADLRMPVETLSAPLKAYVDAGVVEVSGSVVLSAFFPSRVQVTIKDFPDLTGFECFVNGFHIEDYVDRPSALVPQAFSFFQSLSHVLSTQFPQRQFVGIITDSGGPCTATFYTYRESQSYLLDDLNIYEEALCVLALGD